ncbi:MAG: protein kinase [Planctomycetaceae bacterium]
MSQDEITIGNYQLKNCVATGATTQIWEVTQPGSPMQLAMKLLLEDARNDPAEKNVLKHEFKIGKLMEHPSFLRFHEIEINRDHAFFVMDFFASPSLKTHLTSNLAGVQSSFKKLAETLSQAFAFMHEQGWLHRDIKPDNILVNRAGESRVIDFSLSTKIKGTLGKMFAGKQPIQGTRTYIAPETILKKPATEMTDMYSLGITFFEVLTGQAPFAGDTPNDLLKKHLGEDPVAPSVFNPNVTKEMDKIVLQMLMKNPQKRFPSMRELESALRNVRPFDVDPITLREQKIREAKEKAAQSVDLRLDSRADADRVAKGIASPAAPKKSSKVSELFLREEERRQAALDAKKKTSAPAAQQPMPMQPYPGMPYPGMPMQPGMPYPGMPMQPGMPYPGMPMQPGMPYPGMPMQPGMPYPGMPPNQPMPGQSVPGQPVPPDANPGQPGTQPQMPGQQPPQQQPPTTAPPAQQPAAQQPPQPAAPAEEPQEATLDDFRIE